MVCDVLDLRCIFVNELVGSAILSVIVGATLYFIASTKLNFGFETLFMLTIPILLMFGLTLVGFSIIYAFATVVVGVMLSFVFNKIIKNF